MQRCSHREKFKADIVQRGRWTMHVVCKLRSKRPHQRTHASGPYF